MVDKNGKLFGKINLIDLLIVLILAVLVTFVALKVVNKSEENAGLTQVRISFFAEEVPDYVAAALKEGASVLDSKENVTIGTVERFETGDPLGFETDTKGEIQAVQRQGFKSLSLTALAAARPGEHGVTIGGVLYGIGHTLTIYAGNAKLYLKVSGIEPVS
ncbi:MAG: DUF4330 domain-containing protein [Oscillospiraceae bacterium]|jgi:hypothetical protein|nr:DUF4330 domain-containing protein [Oscillospiraceae bacterium]